MPVGVWFSKLALTVVGDRNIYRPKAAELAHVMSPPPALTWTTTSGLDAKNFAVGFVVGTAQQIADLDADAEVWARELPVGWRTLTVRALPARVLLKFNAILTERNIAHGITLSDTLPAAFDKLIAAVDSNYRSLAELEAAMLVALNEAPPPG